MPQTKTTQRRGAAKTAGTTAKKAGTTKKARTAGSKTGVERTADLSEDVLQSVKDGQRAAIEAVRKFVDTVDKALPVGGEHPSKRQDVVDAAMEMADRLVHTQYAFIRKVVDNAGKSLGRSGDAKK